MEFGSIVFLLRFLPIFILIYYMVPGRMKNFILLLGSLCFYAWGAPLYVFLMLAAALSDYCHGLLIEKYQGKRTAGILLGNALFFDGVLLFFFGYADFFFRGINYLAGTELKEFGFPAPLGLTVFMLQTMSYVIEVKRGHVGAQRNFLDYFTYVAMFPQLPGGPIVCYPQIVDSLKSRKTDARHLSSGAKRFCLGLAKKVLLADLAGELWAVIESGGLDHISLGTAWMGILAFAFRMYFTYSGYADMAVGLGSCLGFTYPESFDHPFAATSVTDFLHRWNMTLVGWMREYFYRPALGGSVRVFKKFFFTLAAWGLIGLWYGPDSTFILWGFWMAFFLILEQLFWKKAQEVLPAVFNWLLAMLVVSLGWVLFALNDLVSVENYLKAMFGQSEAGLLDDRFWYLFLEYWPMLAAGVIFSFPYLHRMSEKLRTSRNGFPIAIYRFGEKTVPGILLLLSLLKIIGE